MAKKQERVTAAMNIPKVIASFDYIFFSFAFFARTLRILMIKYSEQKRSDQRFENYQNFTNLKSIFWKLPRIFVFYKDCRHFCIFCETWHFENFGHNYQRIGAIF